MKTLTWKKKRKPLKSESSIFGNDDGNEDQADEVLSVAKRPRVLQLEDSIGKIHRLMNEGIQLAQDERYSQAVERFSEALATASHGVALTPSAIVLRAAPAIVTAEEPAWECVGIGGTAYLIASIHEMKAQALLAMNMYFAAIVEAELAIALCPCWSTVWRLTLYVAFQTLGRAQLNYGELRMAVRSLCRSLHLNPLDFDTVYDDLVYARSLVEQEHCMKIKLLQK